LAAEPKPKDEQARAWQTDVPKGDGRRKDEVARGNLDDNGHGRLGAWERCFWRLRERAIPYDEVTYTLLMHGYTLSHRHSTENAYMVLEEMKQAEVHPALVKINTYILNSLIELRESGNRPEERCWRALIRLAYHCCIRFQKKRGRRLKHELEALEPDDVLALGEDDAVRWIQDHDRMQLPAEGTGRARFLRFQQPPVLLERNSEEIRKLASPRGRKSRAKQISVEED